jgi:transcriptional regulator with XRE-family HTH domain
MIEVEKVRWRRGYTLALTFSDGTSGEADIESELHGVLEPLRDKKLFRRAFVQDGTVNWLDGELDIAPERLYAHVHGLKMPSTLGRAIRNERIVSLRELRKIAGVSQVELAEATGQMQSELSRFERREDPKLSSLRRYVEALGGKLEITALIGKQRVVLHGCSSMLVGVEWLEQGDKPRGRRPKKDAPIGQRLQKAMRQQKRAAARHAG